MRFVLLALSRPLTIVVALVAVALSSVLVVQRMPVDIFPQVGDPAIYVAQPYGGMDPAQMEGFLTYYYEYHFLYITGIDHVESKSIQGATLMKLVFHQGTDMASAMGETIGYVNRARAFMPPGTVPPFVTRFDAGSVAVGELVFSSDNHTQGDLQNIALNEVRPLFATLEGVSAPPPFGGNQRSIVVTLDPDKLRQYHISPEEAISAVSNATLVMPSGNMWTGETNRIARTNATLGPNLEDLLSTPIHPVSGTSIYLRDIGTIESGTDIITAYAHVNGKRTVYIPVTKRADASTLAVISRVKAAMPKFKSAIPEDVDVRLEFDQSGYVSAAIRNLATEGLIGALLTGLMVLLFLRDWRSALIVVLNIPFALFAAVIALWATGQTINIMTIGGLALAVGVLVDEATVSIENIHTQVRPGVSRPRAIVLASRQTAIARFLSMLCVLAVFLPSFFMTGVAKQLFVPLSLAVAFAMISSYLLSSSLVPVLSVWLIRQVHQVEEGRGLFGRLRQVYRNYLQIVLRLRWPLVIGYLAVSLGFLYVYLPRMGTEIFPDPNAPLVRLRLRLPTASVIGGLIGALLNAYANAEILGYVFGGLLVFAGLMGLTGFAEKMKLEGAWRWAGGFVSAGLGGLVGNQGGIRSAAMLGFDLSKESFVATATAIALVVDGARLPVYFAVQHDRILQFWSIVTLATIGVIAGTLLGSRLLPQIPERTFKRVVSLLVFGLGASMIFRPGQN